MQHDLATDILYQIIFLLIITLPGYYIIDSLIKNKVQSNIEKMIHGVVIWHYIIILIFVLISIITSNTIISYYIIISAALILSLLSLKTLVAKIRGIRRIVKMDIAYLYITILFALHAVSSLFKPTWLSWDLWALHLPMSLSYSKGHLLYNYLFNSTTISAVIPPLTNVIHGLSYIIAPDSYRIADTIILYLSIFITADIILNLFNNININRRYIIVFIQLLTITYITVTYYLGHPDIYFYLYYTYITWTLIKYNTTKNNIYIYLTVIGLSLIALTKQYGLIITLILLILLPEINFNKLTKIISGNIKYSILPILVIMYYYYYTIENINETQLYLSIALLVIYFYTLHNININKNNTNIILLLILLTPTIIYFAYTGLKTSTWFYTYIANNEFYKLYNYIFHEKYDVSIYTLDAFLDYNSIFANPLLIPLYIIIPLGAIFIIRDLIRKSTIINTSNFRVFMLNYIFILISIIIYPNLWFPHLASDLSYIRRYLVIIPLYALLTVYVLYNMLTLFNIKQIINKYLILYILLFNYYIFNNIEFIQENQHIITILNNVRIYLTTPIEDYLMLLSSIMLILSILILLYVILPKYKLYTIFEVILLAFILLNYISITSIYVDTDINSIRNLTPDTVNKILSSTCMVDSTFVVYMMPYYAYYCNKTIIDMHYPQVLLDNNLIDTIPKSNIIININEHYNIFDKILSYYNISINIFSLILDVNGQKYYIIPSMFVDNYIMFSLDNYSIDIYNYNIVDISDIKLNYNIKEGDAEITDFLDVYNNGTVVAGYDIVGDATVWVSVKFTLLDNIDVNYSNLYLVMQYNFTNIKSFVINVYYGEGSCSFVIKPDNIAFIPIGGGFGDCELKEPIKFIAIGSLIKNIGANSYIFSINRFFVNIVD